MNLNLKGKLTDREKLLFGAFFITLILFASYPQIIGVNLNDRGAGGPDQVQFTLFKANQHVPDVRLMMGGWQVVSMAPNGITYTVTTHNAMTNCYANMLQYQMATATPKNASGARYIALTTNSTAVNADGHECILQGEQTTNGLQRQQAAVTLNSTALASKVVIWKYTLTFYVTGGSTTLQKAGLTWNGVATCPATNCNQFIAVTAVPSAPTVAVNDQLTVSWVNQFTLT